MDDSTETASELPSPQPPEGFTSDINDADNCRILYIVLIVYNSINGRSVKDQGNISTISTSVKRLKTCVVIARLRARMFDLLDADNSGSISKFEMFEAVKATSLVTAAQL